MKEFENRAHLQAQPGISEQPASQGARDERAGKHELTDRRGVEGQKPTQEGKRQGHGSAQEGF